MGKYTEQQHHGFHLLIQEAVKDALGLMPIDCYSMYIRKHETDPWLSYFKAPLFTDAFAHFKINDKHVEASVIIQAHPDPKTFAITLMQLLSPGDQNDVLGFLSLAAEWKENQLPKGPAWYTIQKHLKELRPWYPMDLTPGVQVYVEGSTFKRPGTDIIHPLSWALSHYLQNP